MKRAFLLLAVAAVSINAQGQGPQGTLATYLERRVGFDAGQLAAVENGQAVVKLLDVSSQRDFAVFGIIKVDVPREFYIARVQDFPASLRAPTRHGFGIFHTPARADDVAEVTITPQDVSELKECRPGACKSKLPGPDMQRLRTEVNWSADDPSSQVNAYVRQRLVEYVTAYRAHGDSALVTYDDAGGVRASDAFATLLTQSPYLYQDVPSLRNYFATFPRGTIDGAREVLFWADDRAPRLRPTLSLMHLVVFAPPELPTTTLVAAKQIYVNHYLEAAFHVTAVVDRRNATEQAGVYLVVLHRFRLDAQPDAKIRRVLVKELRDQVQSDLQRQRDASEQAFATARNPR
jgi:hypothetical protein